MVINCKMINRLSELALPVFLAFIFAIALLAMPQRSQATTLFFNATCDNAFYMYISTNPMDTGTQFGYGNDWAKTYSGSVALIPGVTQYLHV